MRDDKTILETSADRAAKIRDQEMRQIEETAARHRDQAKRDYDLAIVGIEATRKRHRTLAFERCERRMEAASNFVETRNDRQKIASFGLSLPFIHPSSTFGRPKVEAFAVAIAAKKSAAA